MDSNSNHSLTKNEKIAEYAKEISRTRNINSEDFQSSTGSRIRGELGVEKGNAFIKAIKDVNR